MMSWLRCILILAVLISTLTISSSSAVGEDTKVRFLLDRKIEQVTYDMDGKIPNNVQVDSSVSEYHGTRGSVQRRTQDVEEMLQEMATKDPSEWSAAEWLIMILLLSFFGWLGCCLCSLCCCGGGFTNVLKLLCCWEICCRGGSDIDACCDYGLA